MGTAMMLGLGYASYSIRQKIKGKEVKTDKGTIAREALARSGWNPIFQEADVFLEKVSRGKYGVTKEMIEVITGEDAPATTRWASRNSADQLLGPSVGTLKNATAFATAAMNGEGDKTATAAHRLLPYGNTPLFYGALAAVCLLYTSDAADE